MTYSIAIPEGGRLATIDLVDPNSTAVQRHLRRHGLAGYEPATIAALLASFECAPADFGFIDVGANIGLYAVLCAAMFEPGSVTAVEPTPSVARMAQRIVDVNRLDVQVEQVAASASTGTAALHIAASDVSNSLVPGFKQSETEIVVQTATLDDIAASVGNDPVVIKIDVEGHESAVLDGAQDLLHRARPAIVVEVLDRRGGRLADAISTSIDGLGYHCYQLQAEPSWQGFDRVRSHGGHHDWLLLPDPIDDQFVAAWKTWRTRIAACTPDRNSRVPLLRTANAAFRRGGLREVAESAARFVRR